MDSAIQRIENHIQELQVRRIWVARSRNRHLPFSSLPAEIVSEIFLYGLSAQRDLEPTLFPLVLGKVCHSWRQLAWFLPELWATVHCRVSRLTSSSRAALLRDWLDRSGQHLLSIRISMEDEDAWTGSNDVPTELVDIITAHCSRWRNLDLILPESWYGNFVKVCDRLPNLKQLTIRPLCYIVVTKILSAFSATELNKLCCINYWLRDLQFKCDGSITAVSSCARPVYYKRSFFWASVWIGTRNYALILKTERVKLIVIL